MVDVLERSYRRYYDNCDGGKNSNLALDLNVRLKDENLELKVCYLNYY